MNLKESTFSRPAELKGVFPYGRPVLIHDPNSESFHGTYIGLVSHCHDMLCMAEWYEGRIDALIARSDAFQILRSIEHASKRTSALYWLHLADYNLMREDFGASWNKDAITKRIDELMSSILPPT